jgi:transglutaminase-like putative cysteine protease
MRYIVLVLMAFASCVAQAQDYNVRSIPDSLLSNANAVKRFEELHVIIKSLDKVIVKRKYAITILNEQGNDYAEYRNSYSSLGGLSDISGTLYDAMGKKIKSVKRKDIEDAPAGDGVALMMDYRVKVHNFYHRQYPYTIEYEDEQQSSGSYFLQYWNPVPDGGFSVEHSRYIVEAPAGYKLRYKELNLSSKPQVKQVSQMDVYTWELKQFPAMLYERFQPSFSTLTPKVYIGADDFSFGGYAGNMSSWLEFGKFQTTLNKNRDQLPDNIKQEVHKLVDGVADKDEKIRTLYEYMQRNTRYIGIQLGIGGWQPFDAKYVATNKYGDCKALSNYMISLLKEAGIKANYAIVYGGTGRRLFLEDFPVPYYFNHVIACVPGDKDTTWLECTSQTESAGFMGRFTGDRKAILIDDDGGHVVSTPRYTAEQNQQLRHIKALISANGDLAVDVNTRFTGVQQEQAHGLIYQNTKEETEKFLNRSLGLATYRVNKFDYRETKGKLPVIDEYLQVTAPSYANVSGKRLFVVPNLFNRSSTKLSIDTQRKYPIEFPMSYKDVDSIRIEVPDGYIPEAMPKDIYLRTQFSEYAVSYKVVGNTIQVVRKEIINRSRFEPGYYAEVVKYFDAIFKADNSRIVLVKKES